MVKKTTKKQKEPEPVVLTELNEDIHDVGVPGLLTFEELDPSEFNFMTHKNAYQFIDDDEEIPEGVVLEREEPVPKESDEEIQEAPAKKKKKKKKTEKKEPVTKEPIEEDQEFKNVDISKWKGMGIHPKILENLQKLKFTMPTPVQTETIPKAIKQDLDIFLAAQTGSGKTLAFSIPIVSKLLYEMEKPNHHPNKRVSSNEKGDDFDFMDSLSKKQDSRPLRALILSPTRELALQIARHVKAITKGTKLRLAEIVGGISLEKQERLLSYQPEIIVATTGRLWDMMEKNTQHLRDFSELSFFVLDEADRMISDGHFPEFKSILSTIKVQIKDQIRPIQYFVCSATLTLPSVFKEGKRKYKDDKTVDQLLGMIDFQAKPHIVDLTTKGKVATKLTEAHIQCLADDKTLYVYYFTFKYPGRTLVFVNNINAARHLHGVLQLLNVPVTVLHGDLEQKQRLKNLDKFRDEENCLLISTDVSARGLDIPNVKNVIHFDMAKSTETYVHRCGRTARAFNEGFSLMLVAPEDKKMYTEICKSTDHIHGVQKLAVEDSYMKWLRERVRLAKRIEAMQKSHKKSKSSASWFVKHAEEMDIEIDHTFFPGVKKKALVDLQDNKELVKMQEELKKLMQVDVKDKKMLSRQYLTMDPDQVEHLMNKSTPDPRDDMGKKRKSRK